MNRPVNILAISGSTRTRSTNQILIDIIADLFSGEMNVLRFDGLSALPHFNPDLDNEDPPREVTVFRDQLRAADGILICTPEYAMGVPGSLKNALDWTVSSMDFSGKPVALITASSMGEQAHQSLIRTLLVIESVMPEASRLLIPFVKTKIMEGKIVDAAALQQVKDVVGSLFDTIER